jgi:two-component system cell cycle response regulator
MPGRYRPLGTLRSVSSERRTVLVVNVPEEVAGALDGAGYDAEAAPTIEAVSAEARSAAVAVVLGGDMRHVGLGELGLPVVALVEGGASVVDAVRRGAHDVVRLPLDPDELVARVKAAERLTTTRRQLHEASRTDALTGLPNRRHVDEHLEMVSSMARRLRTPFSLLVVDVDRTRRINDEHGHSAGDVVVAEVGRRLAGALRSEDVAGRWGGQEFLVVLPHTPLDGGWRLADRFRAAVCDEPILLPAGGDLVVSVSVGCAEGYGDDIEDHLRRAQAAVDAAKADGRNKVVADT